MVIASFPQFLDAQRIHNLTDYLKVRGGGEGGRRGRRGKVRRGGGGEVPVAGH